MAVRLCKLLLLISVMLMPLAMTPAAAAGLQQGDCHSTMAMEHCPDEGSKSEPATGIAACNMACAAALPAFAGTVARTESLGSMPADLVEPRRLAGLEPESADPPPRPA